MFDLLGDEVKVPINLDLLETEVDYKERMFWERDLMGTALSDNPINKKIESYSNTHAVFFGQINSKKSLSLKILSSKISAYINSEVVFIEDNIMNIKKENNTS